MAKRILLVGGGTGGHVYPLIAVAKALQAQAPGIDLRLMGDGPIFKRAAKENGLRYFSITAPKLRRYASAGNILDVFKVPVALVQSLWHLFWFMPDVVFAKGGYTCAFPTLVARLYGIPVYLHESDSVPGMANRMLAKRSRLVFTAFASADEQFKQMGRPTMLVGNPFRTEVCCVDRAAAHQALQLDPAKKTILVIGGSQGAQQLNELVLNGLVQLVQRGYNVIHQTGEKNFEGVKKAVEQYIAEGQTQISTQYRVYPYFDQAQIATAYGAADVAVTRASAGVLTELSYAGKPMIVVPLPGSANDHQLYNAAELARFGAVVMDGANVSVQVLLAQLEKLLDPAAYPGLAQRIKEFAKPGAAAAIATTLLAA